MTTDKKIHLTYTKYADLETLFLFQADEEANHLAAFTPENPNDKEAYFEKWSKIILNPKINMKTIIIDDEIIGSVSKFEIEGEAEISYIIDKKFWGQGIATHAVKLFLTTEITRPLRGRVAFDNFGSQRVLEKCGFQKTGTAKGFANARQAEIEEFLYQLI